MKRGRYTASRLIAIETDEGEDVEWESAEFDDYEEARRFLAGYAATSLRLNVAISGSALLRALSR